jgi:Ca-activated chloride channel family protein
MNTFAPRLLTGVVTMILLVALSAPAGALIIIQQVPHQPATPYALRLSENNVTVTITDRVAEVTAEFVYENLAEFDLEGTFLFPLPDEAAVDDFSLFVNGEEITAELLDRNRARQIYEDIVRRQKDPALLEFAGRQLLQARIYPITPRDGAKVRLYYTHPVPAEFGTADFVYPLSVEKLEAGSGCAIKIDVNVASTKPLKTVYSPTHTIDLEQDGETLAYVKCVPATAGQRAADFHLLLMVADEKVAANFLTCRDADGVQYFMGMISPGMPDDNEILPKDVVFCLDRSGSMEGEKIEQARAALKFCLNRLNAEDRFGLVVFNSDIEIFNRELLTADSENRNAALAFFQKLPADGGTFIDGALKTSLGMFEHGARPRYLVFLTDGLPTVGERNAAEILAHAAAENRHAVRVFTWGVGYDLNAGLLNDLAQQGRGHASYVEPGQDLEVELSHFFERINRPVLADCKLEISGVKITEIYPPELPDMFAGSEVIVVGRYAGGSPVTAMLTGRQGETYKQFVFAADFSPEAGRYQFLPKLWAGRRIGYLLEDMRRNGENREVIDEVVGLSKQYGIITPYTSFLVAPEQPGLTDGWDHEYGGIPGGVSPSEADYAAARRTMTSEKIKNMPITDVTDILRMQTGEIDRSRLRGGQADELAYETLPVFKTAGGKSFTMRDGFYVDADLLTGEAPADTLLIKKFSDAYFELLKLCGPCSEYFSVGDQVKVIYRGVLIIISDEGIAEFQGEWHKLFR